MDHISEAIFPCRSALWAEGGGAESSTYSPTAAAHLKGHPDCFLAINAFPRAELYSKGSQLCLEAGNKIIKTSPFYCTCSTK